MKYPRDPYPYPQDPSSQALTSNIADGGYAYAQDVDGTIMVVPDGSHVHPKILGSGKPALYAGDLTIVSGKVVDVTNLSGTFRFGDEDGLRTVAEAMRNLGLAVDVGAVRFFPLDGSLPVILEQPNSTELANMKIAILEDNEMRQAEMQRCLHDRFHQFEVVVFAQSKEMVAYLQNNLAQVLAISLDHDLELMPQRDGTLIDGGNGREVADFLALRKPSCPVIIHTTNTPAGDGMEFMLRDAGWDARRVHPFGDLEWISSNWMRTIRDAIVGSARPRETAANGTGKKKEVRNPKPGSLTPTPDS